MSDRRIEILNQRLAAVGETDVAIIDAAELARLRKTNDRWEWWEKRMYEDCAGWSGSLISDYPGQTLIECVDAAIAAEKGSSGD